MAGVVRGALRQAFLAPQPHICARCRLSPILFTGICRSGATRAPLGVPGLLRTPRALSSASMSMATRLRAEVESLVASIHARPPLAVIATTGGAAQLPAWLLTVPGASSTVLEAVTPYSRESLADFLGTPVVSSCNRGVVLMMARQAYRRAVQLTRIDESAPVLGVAATCALVSAQPKKGDHRAWAAVHDDVTTHVLGISLAKGERDRADEDAVASLAALLLLAKASGVTVPPDLEEEFKGSGVVESGVESLGDPLEALVDGRVRCVEFWREDGATRVVVDAPRRGLVLLSGSFNPVHQGHIDLLRTAVQTVRRRGDDVGGVFELTIQNADKGMMSIEEARSRVEGILETGHGVVVTRAPLFTQKGELFPGAWFAVGHDTAVRLVMPKYYGNSEMEMVRQFTRLRASGSRFVVGGRVAQGKSIGSGQGGTAFLTLDDVEIPNSLEALDMFVGIGEREFRRDISSTELRQSRGPLW